MKKVEMVGPAGRLIVPERDVAAFVQRGYKRLHEAEKPAKAVDTDVEPLAKREAEKAKPSKD